MGLPGIGFTMASWMAYRTIRIVTMPVCSAGSNQVGASVTCTAQVIGCWAVARAGPRRMASVAIRTRTRRRTLMSDLLSALSRGRAGIRRLDRTARMARDYPGMLEPVNWFLLSGTAGDGRSDGVRVGRVPAWRTERGWPRR